MIEELATTHSLQYGTSLNRDIILIVKGQLIQSLKGKGKCSMFMESRIDVSVRLSGSQDSPWDPVSNPTPLERQYFSVSFEVLL